MRKRTRLLDIETIRRAAGEVSQGVSVKEVAAKYGVATRTMYSYLKEIGFQLGKKLTKENCCTIASQLRRGSTWSEVSEAYGVSSVTLRRHLNIHGHRDVSPKAQYINKEGLPILEMRRGKRRAISQEDFVRLVSQFKEGAGVKELAAEYGLAQSTINRYMREVGVSLESKKPPKLSATDVEKAHKLLQSGMTTESVSQTLGVTRVTLNTAMKRYGNTCGKI